MHSSWIVRLGSVMVLGTAPCSAATEPRPAAQQMPGAPAADGAMSAGRAAAPSANGSMSVQPSQPGAGASPMMQLPVDTPLSELPAACKGFEVAGLKASPGGSTLPNLCAPFHGTYNNPYAIRCVDADPSYSTRWGGDEMCILPPPVALGTQLHIGPTSYDDPAEVAKFEMAPGMESNTYYYLNSLNTEQHAYYRTNYRMRGGSHHMIISLMAQDREDGWAGPGEVGTDLGLGGMGFGGAQRTDSDRPSGSLEVPPEDVGLGAQLAAKQQFSFNLHHMNHFDVPILREAWVNIWYQDNVTKMARPATLFGNPADVGVAPGEHRVLHYSSEVTGDLRIISYFGHRHVSTDRFGIWIERSSGEKLEAYESFDWEDMPVYAYDSASHNPVPDLDAKVDGGHSGLLELKTGDKVHFVCDITNHQDTTLRFANELMSGEMCIVFGTGVGDGTLGLPKRVMD